MASSADTLFAGGRTLRTVLFVVALLTLVAIVGLPPEENATATVVRLGFELALVLLALAMLAPRRFHWAGRALCGLVFAAYVVYAAVELRSPRGPSLPGRQSDPSLVNALLGLLFIGGPALAYALRPRRTADPFERRVTTGRLPCDAGPEDASLHDELGSWLTPRIAEAGWRPIMAHEDGDDRCYVFERDGVRTLLGTRVEGERPATGSGELVSWHLWLWRDGPVDWREDELARFVERTLDALDVEADVAA